MTERALTDNAADKKRVKDVRQREKQRTARERADLESLLSTVQGRRFVWKLLCDAGLYQVISGVDDFTRGVAEGRRRAGLALIAPIQALNPEYYHLMAKEAHELDEMTTPDPVRDQPETEETEP